MAVSAAFGIQTVVNATQESLHRLSGHTNRILFLGLNKLERMSDDATTRDAGVVKTQLISSRGEVKVDASGDKKYSAGSSAHSSTRNISVNDGVQNNVGNTSKTAAMDTKASRHGEPNDSQNRKVTEPQNINMQSSRGHLDIRDGNNAATSVAAHGIPQGQQPSAEVEADAPRAAAVLCGG